MVALDRKTCSQAATVAICLPERRSTSMDRTRKANREGNEVTLQHQSRNESSLIEAVVEEKLAELQASIEQLKQTPKGLAELQRRVKAFGECPRMEAETSAQFYDKLRRWMDREAPPTKSPLHPPRQEGGCVPRHETG